MDDIMQDPFQDLFDLEEGFYKEGYEAGVADSTYAGKIEGKVFGIEKGYAKALELAKLHGRALVWQARLDKNHLEDSQQDGLKTQTQAMNFQLDEAKRILSPLPPNARLRKHVESLLALTDPSVLITSNTDEAVSEFDEKFAKANAKAKIIANICGEHFTPASASNTGIEDATGLNART